MVRVEFIALGIFHTINLKCFYIIKKFVAHFPKNLKIDNYHKYKHYSNKL